MDALKNWLAEQGMTGRSGEILAALIAAAAVVLLAVAANFIAKRIIIKALEMIIRKTRVKWDDTFLTRRVFPRLSHLAPALVIHATAPVAFGDFPALVNVVQTCAVIYMVVVGLSMVNAFMNALVDIYETFPISKHIYIKTFVQVIKLILYILGGIFILSRLLGQSPLVFFSGLGAFTAVLLLIFKDTILGLVAGVQLMANDMVARGDWIEMPKYGADGDVLDVTLTTVKVQNFDKTIVTVPTYALISQSFKNWRGMKESGGRRIKRSINIDMTSVRFCDEEMLEGFRKFQVLGDYIDEKLAEIRKDNAARGVDESLPINGRRLTNLGIFRAYLQRYLRNHPEIHPDLTFLIRQLEPTPQGLPIQIYVFTRDNRWVPYEGIQADIFDHVVAAIPHFGLRVFQAPAGGDVRDLAGAMTAR